ncbi:MAG TPA: glycosyltransferase family 4 protein [Coriobacteriia bacterium]
MSKPQGINVIGYVSGNLGLAVAARSTISRLLAWRHPVAVVDVDPGAGRMGHDTAFASLECPGVCPHHINVFHLNPPEVISFSKQWVSHASVHATNVCVPFWELPHLPLDWLPIVGMMDLVMAPTHFIREAIEKDLPDVRIVDFPQTVTIPEGVQPDRARWDIADDVVTFLVTFEPASDTARKNPWGAVEAFQRAFPTDEGVALLIKLNRGGVAANRTEDLQRLEAAAKADARIHVFEERLSYVDVLSLYSSVDAIVSLHRAEGLGLHLMEAMSMGKPVIATGWSGNMDFMTHDNSCLVGYDFVRVRSNNPSYRTEGERPEQVWAEPNVDEAANWMLRLVADPALRLSIGERAKESMRSWTEAANATSPFLAIPKVIDPEWSPKRLRNHASFAYMVTPRIQQQVRDSKRRIKSVKRRLRSVKRRVGSALRAMGLRN